jgi:hypothetical protein
MVRLMSGIWMQHGKSLSRHVVLLLGVGKRSPQSLSYPLTAEALLLDDDGEIGSTLFDVICHSVRVSGGLGPRRFNDSTCTLDVSGPTIMFILSDRIYASVCLTLSVSFHTVN